MLILRRKNVIFFSVGAAFAQDFTPETGTFIKATSRCMQEPLLFETQKTREGVRYTWGRSH